MGKKNKGLRWELLLVVLLLVPLGAGALFLFNHMNLPEKEVENSGNTLLVTAKGSQEPESASRGKLYKGIPSHYQVQGTVGNQYTVAIDPETGEMVVQDTEADVGTNTTSVEGKRVELAKDMLNMERYAEENKASLSRADYQWYKDTASAGMALAFGAPGVSQDKQLQIKSEALQAFSEQLQTAPENVAMDTYGDQFLDYYNGQLAGSLSLLPKLSLQDYQLPQKGQLTYDSLNQDPYLSFDPALNTTSSEKTTYTAVDIYKAAGWNLTPSGTKTSTTTTNFTTSPTSTTTSSSLIDHAPTVDDIQYNGSLIPSPLSGIDTTPTNPNLSDAMMTQPNLMGSTVQQP